LFLVLVKKETTLGEIRPEWKKEKLGSITLIELATHRSGLPKLPCNLHYRDEKYPYADYTQNDLVMSLKDEVIAANPKCSLKDHPSSEIHYSNWGAGLLGDAIAHVAKSTYPKLLKKWITDPLGMHDTVVNLNKNQKKRLAKGYDHNLTPRGLWDRKTLDGSGAIRSTAKDLIKYAQAFLHPELIPFESSLRRVMTLEYQDEQAKIGYNWFITPTGSIWHNGMTGGYSSMIKIYLKNDFAIFNLVNTEYSLECFIAAVEEVACP
jgi:CubicO group peptidase (beta-lactamase class C family)